MNYYISDLHLFHKNVTEEGSNFDSRPFKTLEEMHQTIKERWNSVITNLAGNIVAFAPFGFLLPIVSRDNRDFLSGLLYSFEFSLFIELIQLSFQVGAFDIDDIILNTLGGVFGFFMFCILKSKVKIKAVRGTGYKMEEEND